MPRLLSRAEPHGFVDRQLTDRFSPDVAADPAPLGVGGLRRRRLSPKITMIAVMSPVCMTLVRIVLLRPRSVPVEAWTDDDLTLDS